MKTRKKRLPVVVLILGMLVSLINPLTVFAADDVGDASPSLQAARQALYDGWVAESGGDGGAAAVTQQSFAGGALGGACVGRCCRG